MDTIDSKLNECFGGKVVRKDLTKSIKEGANVPSYVLVMVITDGTSPTAPLSTSTSVVSTVAGRPTCLLPAACPQSYILLLITNR